MIKINPNNKIIVLAALLVVLLGLTAYYLSMNNYNIPQSLRAPEFLKIETQSSSDEVSAIEQDLEDTDIEGIDKELSGIEAELQ